MSGTIVAIFLIILCHSSNSTLLRQNYGLMLEEAGYLTTNKDNFNYIFIISFPQDLPSMDNISTIQCEPLVWLNSSSAENSDFMSQCIQLNQILQAMQNGTHKLANKLSAAIQNIKMLLPEHNTFSRHERKLFSFLGSIWESLTGSPSQRSFEKLKHSITFLQSENLHLKHKMKQIGNDMAAYMNLNNHRLSSIIDKLHSNNKLIATKLVHVVDMVKSNFEKSLNLWRLWKAHQLQLSHVFLTAIDHIQYQSELSLSAESMLEQWLLATEMLLQQNLPITLVPPDQLKQALNHITDILYTNNIALELEFTSLPLFYQFAITHATFSDTNLYIQVTIPLKPKDKSTIFLVYQTITIGVPIPDNSSVSLLQNIPDFLAVSEDKSLSISMDLKTWSTCRGHGNLKHCTTPFSIHILDGKYCIDALYLDNSNLISQNCKFKILPKTRFPHLMNFGQYAIFNGHTKQINCFLS